MAEVTFSDDEFAPVPKFGIRIRVRKIFKFENPTLVQTPTIIDAPKFSNVVT